VKSIFAESVQAGDELRNEPFLLQDVLLRKTKDNRPYILGAVRDKSGQLPFVFWDVPDYVLPLVQAGKVVLISGRVNNYKDALQIGVTDIHEALNPDMSAFLPTSKRSRESMLAELHDIVGLLKSPWQPFVTHLLLQEPFLSLFANAPAARKMHHAYIGGLLEHSLSMANLAHQLADHYPYVQRDLLVSGTLLHDIGKAIEYDVQSGFSFSDDGRLVGHIVRAVVLIEKAAATTNLLSETELRDLVHLISSHHGTLEWGSPTTPKTAEAILLHQIDLLDSRMQGYYEHLDSDASNGDWSLRPSPMFGTELRYPADYPRFTSETDG
jgi:3'-5' exoribonuclease